MDISARLTRCPRPFDAEAAADLRAGFDDQPADLRDLIAGAGSASPYLRASLGREGAWLRDALTRPPEDVLADTLDGLDEPESATDLGPALRVAKRRLALLIALCDLGGVWELPAVTGALTALADRAVATGLRALVAPELRRGKIPGAGPDDAEDAAGMVVLAMGKMGAGELNYSSDIDLICLFDDTRFEGATEVQEARAAFIRVTRKLCALLSDLTGEGYVFRTDLRLRPDAAVTPVCVSMEAAERYYESVGRTWERAAYIKARPCAGDVDAGARFLRTLTPFVWRRHLDFAAIQDAHDMRLRIRDHRGLHGPIGVEGHDMKLGPGGIREIEFFTQTRQIIAGGRDPELRERGTEAALGALARKGWVPEAVADELRTLYRAHREVEHRVQMVNDQQTHELPATAEGIDRLARLCGAGDTEAWRADIKARLDRVAELTEGFFAPDENAEDAEALTAFTDADRDLIDGWRDYPALRSDRAVEIFQRVRPEILRRLARSSNPSEALVQFDGFLRGLPAGVQLFSLFEANPALTRLIVDITATAPRLAQYLSRNAGVLDAVIGGDFFADWPGAGALRLELSARLAEAGDYEAQLDAARRWAKEWHFRIGVHHLRGLIDGFEAGSQYADLADAVLGALWAPVAAEFARKHGAPPGAGAAVLAMGSLGAARLNAASDLDLIVIYDAPGDAQSDGRRPLSARAYYARLTQAFVTALTAPTAEGRLYEVDMRLRPSGRQGPVATALTAFRTYQSTEAWTWEHLALTRARPVAGSEEIAAQVEEFRRALLPEKGQAGDVRANVARMRARLRDAKPARGPWEAKQGPGRLQDIELGAQMAALVAGSPARRTELQLRAGVRAGVLDRAQADTLTRAYRLCWRLQAAARLLSDGPLDPSRMGEGACAFLLQETGATDADDLTRRLAKECDEAAGVIDAVIGMTGGKLHGEGMDGAGTG